MKPILPTLKERKRYILFKIYCKKELDKEKVAEQVLKACLQFLGELGVADGGIHFLPETWNKKNQTGIIRCGHKWADKTRAALSLVKEIDGEKAKIECLRVSGVINKLRGRKTKS